MRGLLCWLGLILVLPIVFISCSSDTPTDSSGGGGDFDLTQAENDIAAQSTYHQNLTQLAAQMDTTSALDSLVTLLEADPDVAWATNVNTGVNIQWRSGLRGGITIRTLAGLVFPMVPGQPGKPAGPLQLGPPPQAADAAPPHPESSNIYTTPTHRNALYLAACYSEFQTHDDTVLDWAATALPEAGYATFTVYKEAQVTLAALRSLSAGEWGIIRLSSHGAPYPSQQDVQSVYLLTGEVVSESANQANEAGLAEGSIGVNNYFGTNQYSVAAEYIAQHNNFGSTHPLILNGFCYSHLGNWSSQLRSVGAGGVFGWDWECWAGTDAAYTKDMLETMLARSAATPTTLQRWFAQEEPWYQAGERRVEGHIAAADSFALWPPANVVLESLEDDTIAPGDAIYLYGHGFGSTIGKVFFGTTQAAVLAAYTWSDTQIYIEVPEGLPAGNTTVKVVTAANEESNTLPVYIQDELMDVLHETTRVEVYFSADHVFDPWTLDTETAFSVMHQNLLWEENTFYGREVETTSNRSRRIDIVGAIDLAERTCALEYEYADTVYTIYGGHYIVSKSAAFSHVPLTSLGSSLCRFGAEGTGNVQPLVSTTLTYERTTFGNVGDVYPGSYVRTDWGYGYPRLSLDFEW